MSESPLLLRVVNIQAERKTRWEDTSAPRPKPFESIDTTVLLAPFGPSFEVLGGQRVVLYLHDSKHPLLRDLVIDQIFELRPVTSAAPSPPASEEP